MWVIVRKLAENEYRNTTPTVMHATEADAIKEAQRLADSNVGSEFEVYQLVKTGSALNKGSEFKHISRVGRRV